MRRTSCVSARFLTRTCEGDGELRVRVSFDKDKRTLTISDNGVGMTRDEVIDHLGTIAKSGTKSFLESWVLTRRKTAS